MSRDVEFVLSSAIFIDLTRQDNQEEISFQRGTKTAEGIEQRQHWVTTPKGTTADQPWTTHRGQDAVILTFSTAILLLNNQAQDVQLE